MRESLLSLDSNRIDMRIRCSAEPAADVNPRGGRTFMAILPQAVRCMLNRHLPERHKAGWNGTHFAGTCKGCGAPIRREGPSKWRKHWNE